MTTLEIDMCDEQTQEPKCGCCGSSETPTAVLELGLNEQRRWAPNGDIVEVCSCCLAEWLEKVKKVEVKVKARMKAERAALADTAVYDPPYCPNPHHAEQNRMAEESQKPVV